MGWLASKLDIGDSEHVLLADSGKGLLFTAVNERLAYHNAEIASMLSIFVERTTEKFTERYLLPGGGKLQRLGMQSPATAVKRSGYYDVGYQLNKYGAVLAGDEDTLGYMTVQELQAQLDNIMAQDLNMMRWRILVSLFENTNLAFTDPYRANATTTVTRLANTDGTLYPPIVGSETEADDNHYLYSGYDVADILITANPVATCVAEIAEHFGGTGSTGKNFVYFHANDQTAYLKAIAGYVAIEEAKVQLGDDTARLRPGWPKVPGTVHGVLSGAYLSEWDGWIVDKYGLCILLGVPAPLIMRVHPESTGLGRGLIMASQDEHHPVMQAHYKHDYGFGCGNRLSAACIEISEDGAYTPPTGYAE